jgi:hypothetical protein
VQILTHAGQIMMVNKDKALRILLEEMNAPHDEFAEAGFNMCLELIARFTKWLEDGQVRERKPRNLQ